MLLPLLLACADSTRTAEVGDVRVTTLRRDYANAHLVATPEGSFLVDPGGEAHAAAIDDALRDLGQDPSDLRAVVLTHGHADHAGAASWFQGRHGVPVVAGAGDAALFASGENDELCPTDARAERRHAQDQAASYAPFEPDVWVDAEGTLDAVGLPGVRVAPAPGHTAGSVVFAAGDALFAGDLLRGSILGREARTHFYVCDEAAGRAEVRGVRERFAPGATWWFTGHFGPLEAEEVDAWLADPR